jgi:hypothetical protein
MDFRNSKLIVTLAIAFGVIVSMVAYVGFRDAGRDLFGLSRASDSDNDRYPRYDRRYARTSRNATPRDDIRSLRKLRELVESKNRLLKTRTEELRRVSNRRDLLKQDLQELQLQVDRLQRQNEQTMSAYIELSSQVEGGDHRTTTIAREAAGPRTEPSGDGAGLDVELDLIEWQIEQANQRVAELELTALREMVRSSEATQALVATGSAAVPALLDRLADADPDVRQWAANVLGQIGPDASLAVEALLQALNDEIEVVREAARVALDRIENRS